MLSAYYYYGLTDNVPDKIHLAVERDGTKIRDEIVVEYFIPKWTGGIGVANTVLHGMDLDFSAVSALKRWDSQVRVGLESRCALSNPYFRQD